MGSVGQHAARRIVGYVAGAGCLLYLSAQWDKYRNTTSAEIVQASQALYVAETQERAGSARSRQAAWSELERVVTKEGPFTPAIKFNARFLKAASYEKDNPADGEKIGKLYKSACERLPGFHDVTKEKWDELSDETRVRAAVALDRLAQVEQDAGNLEAAVGYYGKALRAIADDPMDLVKVTPRLKERPGATFIAGGVLSNLATVLKDMGNLTASESAEASSSNLLSHVETSAKR